MERISPLPQRLTMFLTVFHGSKSFLNLEMKRKTLMKLY